MRFLFILIVGFMFVGCSSKNVSVSTPMVDNAEVRSAMLSYKRAKSDKAVQKYASEELYKATKIAKVLSNMDNSEMAKYYAKLLKKQVKIAELTKKEYELTNEVNDIVVKRNEAIADAKHQQDTNADESDVEDDSSGEATLVTGVDELKQSFGGDNNTFTINGKYFDNDDLILNSKLKGLISYLANYLTKNSSKKLVLNSYTDGIGSTAYSIDMALRRANRLKEELVDKGIDENRIDVEPKGAVDFVGSNDDEKGRNQNNRIVAILE